jgi:hypothetical protein
VDLAGLLAESDSVAAAGVFEHHSYHHGGIMRFISMSLDTLGVPPDRRAQVEKLHHELDASMQPERDAERSFVVTLARGIADGRVDAHAIGLEKEKLSAAAAAVLGATTASELNQLHALLTPLERTTLFYKAEGHWEVWRAANSEASLGRSGSAGGGDQLERLVRLAGELALNPAQVDTIRAQLRTADLPSSEEPDDKLVKEVDDRLESFGAAFCADTFDARSLAADSVSDAHLATAGAMRMARFFELAAPVLTPAQRALLAVRLRERFGIFESVPEK